MSCLALVAKEQFARSVTQVTGPAPSSEAYSPVGKSAMAQKPSIREFTGAVDVPSDGLICPVAPALALMLGMTTISFVAGDRTCRADTSCVREHRLQVSR
jgi:hypothetical protein